MLKQILSPLSNFGKFRLVYFFFLILFATFFEIISLGTLIPVISAVVEENTQDIIFFNYINNFFFISSRQEFIKIILIVIFSVFFIKFVLMTYITVACNFFINRFNRHVSEKLLKIYLSQSIVWHSNFNKSSFLNLLTTEVKKYSAHTINSFIHITIDLCIFFGIIIFLFFLNVKIFLYLLTFSSCIFFLIFFFSKKISYKLGKTSEKTSRTILTFLNENLSGIKEILLYSSSHFILNKFENLNNLSLKNSALHESYQDIFRFILEFFGLIIILIIFYLIFYDDEINKSLQIATLGIYAASLFKLMPIFNRISTYSQKLRFGVASIEKINDFLKNQLNSEKEIKKIDIVIKSEIFLKNITFRYKPTQDILKNINLRIKKNILIGIKGESGSGKTTLSNIIMNLIKPNEGTILVDGKDIYSNNLCYQKTIGFVSQNFFHIDDTILKNITLNEDKIHYSLLRNSLKNSLLFKAIRNKQLRLKDKLGNQALKISGGQLQRINIARALYRNPKILILDEPTSALDVDSQKELAEIIIKLKENMIIVLITHNNEMLNICDEKYEIKNKKINQL